MPPNRPRQYSAKDCARRHSTVFASRQQLDSEPRTLHRLIGVLLTVVMLGLSAPLWSKTVNGLPLARDMMLGDTNPT